MDDLPHCIVGDFDSIRNEVQEFYKKKNVKLLMRMDQDTTDLEKCLYVSLEKISEITNEGNEDFDNQPYESKKFAIIILGSSGGRIDHTFSTYSHVCKYLNSYGYQLGSTDIFLLARSSCTVYLKQGINSIKTSSTFENKEEGYSIIPLFGEGKISIDEDNNNNGIIGTIPNKIREEHQIW